MNVAANSHRISRPTALALLATLLCLPASSSRAQDLPPEAQQSLSRTVELRQQGRNAEALSTLGQLVQEYPKNDRLQFESGATLFAQGRSAEAETFLKRTVELQEEQGRPSATSYNALGWVQLVLGEYPVAEENLTKALQLAEANPTARETTVKVLNNLGLLAIYQGNIDDAERYFRRAVDEFGSEQAQKNLRMVGRARAVEQAPPN